MLAQIFASKIQPTEMASALSRLVPFLVIVGFAAGLAAEVVLSTLRKSGAAITIEVPVPKAKI